MSESTQPIVPAQHLLAWELLLRSHSYITKVLDGELRAEHGLTLHDYEVLLHLMHAPDNCLKMSALAENVLLTRSGMTRLVDGLVRSELVERQACTSDARVIWAALTERGLAAVTEARTTHHHGISRLFAEHISDDEAQRFQAVLSRLVPGCGTPGT